MPWHSPQPQADPVEEEGTTEDGDKEDAAATAMVTAPKLATNAAASTTWHEIINTRIQAPKRPMTPQP